MCDSLHWTPTNRREKFDAASFIIREIRNGKQTNKKVRPSSGTAVYPHMPILRLHRCDILADACVARALADFGLLGSKFPQNVRIPAQYANESPCKI